MIADHTGVPDSMRCTGTGSALVARKVADARHEGFDILPPFPFVNAEHSKHPDRDGAFRV